MGGGGEEGVIDDIIFTRLMMIVCMYGIWLALRVGLHGQVMLRMADGISWKGHVALRMGIAWKWSCRMERSRCMADGIAYCIGHWRMADGRMYMCTS